MPHEVTTTHSGNASDELETYRIDPIHRSKMRLRSQEKIRENTRWRIEMLPFEFRLHSEATYEA